MDLKNLFTEKPAPLYDKELHSFGASLITSNTDLFNSSETSDEFKNQFDQWIHSSEFCKFEGLVSFQHRDVIQGVTQFIDDIYQMNFGKVYSIEGDYLYHKRLYGDTFAVKDVLDIPNNSQLIFSFPFPKLGDIHPDTEKILNICRLKNIKVHIDAAWVGSARDLQFNFNHPAIYSIGFSLSKGLGLGYSRIGIRYSRERTPGPITIMNDFTMIPRPMCWWGIEFIQKFGHDYLQKKYYKYYQQLCKEYNLIETKCIHLAYEQQDHNLRPVGIRRALEYLQKHDRS